jgi:hypothetical protein
MQHGCNMGDAQSSTAQRCERLTPIGKLEQP